MTATAFGIGASSLLVALLVSASGQAAPNCMTRIIADVAAEEAPEQMKSKSQGEFGPVTTIKVDRASGRMTYCTKNSYCYNSNAFQFVTPCRLKQDKEKTSTRFFSYFTR